MLKILPSNPHVSNLNQVPYSTLGIPRAWSRARQRTAQRSRLRVAWIGVATPYTTRRRAAAACSAPALTQASAAFWATTRLGLGSGRGRVRPRRGGPTSNAQLGACPASWGSPFLILTYSAGSPLPSLVGLA
eukprot:5934260-Pleurochrysis_carterae.AAC.2